MISLMNQIAQNWWVWMGQMLWQASLLVLIVGGIDWLTRRWIWPQVRYALWALVLIKLLIPPGWSLPSGIIPPFQHQAQNMLFQTLTIQTPGSEEGIRQFSPGRHAVMGLKASDADQNGEEVSGSGKVKPVWQVYAFIIWILGMGIFLALLGIRISKLKRWHKKQEEKKTIPEWFHQLLIETAKKFRLDRLPAIVFSDQAVAPAVYGLFRPVLLLPAGYFNNLSKEEAEHVLLHELAHLKRGDLWIHGLFLFLQITYWFNPLLVLARRQMKHTCELCCDQTIAGFLKEKTKKYRQTLVNTARELLTESLEPGMSLLGVFEEPFKLMARLRWLEKRTRPDRKAVAAAIISAGLIMGFFIMPMARSESKAEAAILSTGTQVTTPSATIREQSAGQYIYIKEVTWADSYVLWARAKSEVEAVKEIWIGDQVIIRTTRNSKTIFDFRKNLLTYIDHEAKTYMITPLPLDVDAVLTSKGKFEFEKRNYTGRVKKLSTNREVGGKICDTYEVTAWSVWEQGRKNKQTYKVWATKNVDFDISLYPVMLDNMRKTYGRDQIFRQELAKIEGLQMRNEITYKKGPLKKKFIEEVKEITRKEAPDWLMTIPEDYKKKDRLDLFRLT